MLGGAFTSMENASRWAALSSAPLRTEAPEVTAALPLAAAASFCGSRLHPCSKRALAKKNAGKAAGADTEKNLGIRLF